MRQMNGAIRYGIVEGYDASRHMGKVKFMGYDGIISDWLPVLLPFTSGNRAEIPLDIGTHVACLMTEGSGVILGAFYDDKNKPQAANENVTSLTFSDGTSVKYDRESHKLEINCAGDIEITASGNIKLTAGRIDFN